MVFVDKIFLKVYLAYKNKFNSDTPIIYSVSYLVVMLSMHVIVIMKFLNLLGIETDTEQYSKFQKTAVIILIYVVFGIKYYYFFNPIKFREKHGFSDNYKPIIIYTVAFFVAFWILILVF